MAVKDEQFQQLEEDMEIKDEQLQQLQEDKEQLEENMEVKDEQLQCFRFEGVGGYACALSTHFQKLQ